MPPGMFPAAARANKSIFYDRQGNARSVAGVYSELNRRYQVARANVVPGVAPTAVAANTAAPSAAPAATPPAPDTAGTTNAFAVAAARPVVAGAEPVFRSLFRTVRVSWRWPRWRLADRLGIVGRGSRGCAGIRYPERSDRDRPGGRRQRQRRTSRSICSGTCGRTCAACSGAATARERSRGRRAVNDPAIFPKIYGERFIKHRGLTVAPIPCRPAAHVAPVEA